MAPNIPLCLTLIIKYIMHSPSFSGEQRQLMSFGSYLCYLVIHNDSLNSFLFDTLMDLCSSGHIHYVT